MTPKTTHDEADDFRHRALAEAARYGADPWVFVRELLQNSRDAGARRVDFDVSTIDGVDRISCRDDGEGMTWDAARRYLLALYASSKEQVRDQAGKFGIGFWSVLRFEPDTITIRSRAAGEAPWEVTIDGALDRVTRGESELDGGTEIVLGRGSGDPDPVAGALPAALAAALTAVLAAARRYGRFLTRRDARDEPLWITVNGEPVNADFTLPAPCAGFRGKGFRGVVALGGEPRVELFAHGLFVRSASHLQDLRDDAEPRGRSAPQDALSELPSQAPQVLLDSSAVDLLLARSDARQDKHFQRMLRRAERELKRLITRQLQALRPQPWYRLWWGALHDRLEPWLRKPELGRRGVLAAVAAALVLGAALFFGSLPEGIRDWLTESVPDLGVESQAAESVPGAQLPESDLPPPEARSPEVAAARSETPPSAAPVFHRYSDLGESYRGPRPGISAGSAGTRLALRYEPTDQLLLFHALVLDEIGDGEWATSPDPGRPSPERDLGPRCGDGCVTVRLAIAARAGALRLPVPTGHRLVDRTAWLDGRRVPVRENRDREAILVFERSHEAVVEYRTAPARAAVSRAPAISQAADRQPASLPTDLRRNVESLRSRPLGERVQAAVDLVADRIRYDPDRPWVGSPDRDGFVATALRAGYGDCDVLNGVLTVLLQRAGVRARLAVGYVGMRGLVSPGLHAWVEYLDEAGRWQVADASLGPVATRPEPPDRVPVLAASVLSPAGRSRTGGSWWLLVLALVAGGSVMAWRRRPVSSVDLGGSVDLAALLGGALRHPGAFADLPAMFHGRFVPLFGGRGAISLARARRLAEKGRLFRTERGSRLARQAAARGVPVVDDREPEGRVLSLALGAIDLDPWTAFLDRSSETPLTSRLNRHLGKLGEPWRAAAVQGLPQAALEIDLAGLRLGPRRVLVDLGHDDLAAVRGLAAGDQVFATFALADFLVHRLDLDPRAGGRLLAGLAGEALAEALTS